MEYIWYLIAGALGGVLGGMGMGGGTILIPLLTIFFNVNQHSAQAANLISFTPMATIALIIHLKNKLVEFENILYIILAGVLTCVIGVYLAQQISSTLLKRIFGGFLVLLSIFQIIKCFTGDKENKTKTNNEKA